MRRDMDYIRELLLEIEGGRSMFETLSSSGAEGLGIKLDAPVTAEEADRVRGHLDLLENADFIEVQSTSGNGTVTVGQITWAGHDFLDAVREPHVWTETKSRAQKISGWTAGVLTDLAKGYLKAEAAKHGFPMG